MTAKRSNRRKSNSLPSLNKADEEDSGFPDSLTELGYLKECFSDLLKRGDSPVSRNPLLPPYASQSKNEYLWENFPPNDSEEQWQAMSITSAVDESRKFGMNNSSLHQSKTVFPAEPKLSKKPRTESRVFKNYSNDHKVSNAQSQMKAKKRSNSHSMKPKVTRKNKFTVHSTKVTDFPRKLSRRNTVDSFSTSISSCSLEEVFEVERTFPSNRRVSESSSDVPEHVLSYERGERLISAEDAEAIEAQNAQKIFGTVKGSHPKTNGNYFINQQVIPIRRKLSLSQQGSKRTMNTSHRTGSQMQNVNGKCKMRAMRKFSSEEKKSRANKKTSDKAALKLRSKDSFPPSEEFSSFKLPTSFEERRSDAHVYRVLTDTEIEAPASSRKKWVKNLPEGEISLKKIDFSLGTYDDTEDNTSASSESSGSRRWKDIMKFVTNGSGPKLKGNSESDLLEMNDFCRGINPRRDTWCSTQASSVFRTEFGDTETASHVPLLHENDNNVPGRNIRKSNEKHVSSESNSIQSENTGGNSSKTISGVSSKCYSHCSDSKSDIKRSLNCVENCSIIEAFFPILFSHSCYQQKVKDYNSKTQSLAKSVKENSSKTDRRKAKKLPNSDTVDGQVLSKYEIPKTKEHGNASQDSSSPQLLSYKTVEPVEEPYTFLTYNCSTQTVIPTSSACLQITPAAKDVSIQCKINGNFTMEKSTQCGDSSFNRAVKRNFSLNSSDICSSVRNQSLDSEVNWQKVSVERTTRPLLQITSAKKNTSPSVSSKLVKGKVSERVRNFEATSKEGAGLKQGHCQVAQANRSLRHRQYWQSAFTGRNSFSVGGVDEVDVQSPDSDISSVSSYTDTSVKPGTTEAESVAPAFRQKQKTENNKCINSCKKLSNKFHSYDEAKKAHKFSLDVTY